MPVPSMPATDSSDWRQPVAPSEKQVTYSELLSDHFTPMLRTWVCDLWRAPTRCEWTAGKRPQSCLLSKKTASREVHGPLTLNLPPATRSLSHYFAQEPRCSNTASSGWGRSKGARFRRSRVALSCRAADNVCTLSCKQLSLSESAWEGRCHHPCHKEHSPPVRILGPPPSSPRSLAHAACSASFPAASSSLRTSLPHGQPDKRGPSQHSVTVGQSELQRPRSRA